MRWEHHRLTRAQLARHQHPSAREEAWAENASSRQLGE